MHAERSSPAMISILFETPDVLAVNKPEGMPSIPAAVREHGSLVELLGSARGEKLFVVHRLDRDTSGVVLLARNAAAHRLLNEQFSSQKVRKTYLAVVHGVPATRRGQINLPLREFGSGRMGVDLQRGKPATTVYQIVESLETNYALLEVSPLTGRRHQIRVHLYSIGHPVVGDLRYGDKAVQVAYPRLMLHAQRIEFSLPSGERVVVEAPLPESFTSFLKQLRP